MTAFRPGPHVAVEAAEGALFVARLPDGPIIVLEGIAALIWTESCQEDTGDLADRIAAQVDREASEIAEDVADFLSAMVRHGLLNTDA
jgi:nucleotide-binding universal stress UspA family protein